MRVPWGEGNGDGGVSARGSCQGGGCTAPRPCPGFPFSRERRWGSWREGFVSGWGMHRPAPLPWIPDFAGAHDGGWREGFGDAALDSRFRGRRWGVRRGVRVRMGDLHRPGLPWIPAFA